MKLQMLTNVFVLQTRSQQDCRRVNRPCCHNHSPGMYSYTVCLACFCIGYTGSDAHRFAVLNKYLVRVAVYNDMRAMIKSVLQVGLHRGLLGSVATAKAACTAA